MMPRFGLGSSGRFQPAPSMPSSRWPAASRARSCRACRMRRAVRIQRRCVSANQKREHDLILDGRSLEPLKYGFGILGACLKQIAGQKHRCEGAGDWVFSE
jgi:hypothetical protein